MNNMFYLHDATKLSANFFNGENEPEAARLNKFGCAMCKKYNADACAEPCEFNDEIAKRVKEAGLQQFTFKNATYIVKAGPDASKPFIADIESKKNAIDIFKETKDAFLRPGRLKRTEYEIKYFGAESGDIRFASHPPILSIAKILDELKTKNFDDIYKFTIYALSKTYDTSAPPKKPSTRCMDVFQEIDKTPGKLIHSQTTEYTFFAAKSIKTGNELKKDCKKKYKNINSFSMEDGMNDKMPAVITYVHDKTSIGLKKHPNDHKTTINWGKTILCQALNPRTDIVINQDLTQIFPKKTGRMPIILKKLIENEKNR